MNSTVRIRPATANDAETLARIAQEASSPRSPGYFERCMAERDVFLAFEGGEAAGFVHLNRRPSYAPFARAGLFEVQDLCVAPAFRRQGLGRFLVAHCEQIVAAEGGTDIAISVGLTASYGPAQRLYAKMGYVPDGAGLVYDDMPVRPGELRPADDNLTLKLTKSLA